MKLIVFISILLITNNSNYIFQFFICHNYFNSGIKSLLNPQGLNYSIYIKISPFYTMKN